MKKYVALAALMTAFATPVMAQAPAQPAPMMASMTGAQFRQMAMMSDAFEVESSRLALARSRNAGVRNFANMMIEHHSAMTAALGGGATVAGGAATGAIVGAAVGGPVGAAVGAGVGATTAAATPRFAAGPMLDARHADMLNQLAAARGAQFDRLYGRMQRMAHEEAIALFTAQAQSGADPSYRNFAAQALPTLEEHYAMARRLPR